MKYPLNIHEIGRYQHTHTTIFTEKHLILATRHEIREYNTYR